MQIRQILFSGLVLGMLMPAAASFAQGFPGWQWPMQWPAQPSGTTQPSGTPQSPGAAQPTSRISLTPSEAQAFWPIYNEFDAQKDVLYKQRADIAMRYMRNAATLSDKELEQMLNDYWNINQKEYRLSAEYHRKFLSVLSSAKVMRLYMTEEQFKNSYLQRMRGGQEQGRGMAGNGRSADQRKE